MNAFPTTASGTKIESGMLFRFIQRICCNFLSLKLGKPRFRHHPFTFGLGFLGLNRRPITDSIYPADGSEAVLNTYKSQRLKESQQNDNTLMCLNTGTPKTIYFPFGTNGKLLCLGVLVLMCLNIETAKTINCPFGTNGKSIVLGVPILPLVGLYQILKHFGVIVNCNKRTALKRSAINH